MIWLKYVERLGYHVLLNLLIHGGAWLFRLFIMLCAVISCLIYHRRQLASPDEKKLLHQLNQLINLIDAGNSPAYSYLQIGQPDLPEQFIHPTDPYFSAELFKRQAALFEKRIILREELEADFAISRFRMSLMKFLPIILMLAVQLMIDEPAVSWIERIVVLGFMGTYYLAEGMLNT